jgi:hypothetical protein
MNPRKFCAQKKAPTMTLLVLPEGKERMKIEGWSAMTQQRFCVHVNYANIIWTSSSSMCTSANHGLELRLNWLFKIIWIRHILYYFYLESVN